MKLLIKNVIPKNWNFKEEENSIKIWYDNFKQKNPQPIILNKEITISKELGILMGFWAGDGTKRTFSLCNNQIIIIKEMNNLLDDIFGLDGISLRTIIPSNFKNKEQEILNLTKKTFPTIHKHREGYYKQNRNSPIWVLQYPKTTFIKLFKILYNYVLHNVGKHHEYWDGYLQGIIAAEGHMDIRKKYKTLSRVSIAQISNNFRKSIMRALDTRNITYYIDKKYIRISGKKNFKIILKRDLYSLHPKKKELFLIGYNNIKQKQYYPNEVIKLILNELRTPKRISTIARNLNRCRQTIREHLLLKKDPFYNQGLIKLYGKERGARGSLYGV